jgi:D-alanyl-D-alanine carboxypeptidase
VPVGWLPEQFPYGDRIIVRQLLNHTSGVPPFGDLEFLVGRFDEQGRRFTPEELLARIEGQPLGVPPRRGRQQLQHGHILLGLIAQRVTGQPSEIALRRRILAPLRQTDTSFEVGRSFPAPRVRGYAARPGTAGPVLDVTRMNPSWAWAAGNLVIQSERDSLPTRANARHDRASTTAGPDARRPNRGRRARNRLRTPN